MNKLKDKNQRGQLTIFIILAIVIVGVVLVFFAIRGGIFQQILTPNTEKVQNFVQNCIDETGTDIIYQIGQNGGYYFPSNLSTSSGVSIYYENGKNYLPSKKQIEEEISSFFDYELFFCTRNFVDFPDMNILQGEIKTETKIENERVVLNVNYPITITKDNSGSRIENFKAEIPTRMGIVYDSVSEFLQNQTDNGICLSCLLEATDKNDLYVEMMDYDEKTVIFVFRDKNSKIKDEEFVWVFANRYE